MIDHPTRVLLIEDNRDLALGLRVNFEERGYDVTVARTGAEALKRARQAEHELFLLDLTLPDLDGLDVLDALRKEGNSTPVIVLTARSHQASKIRGLRAGADDYVTKPFDIEELLARVEVILRRAKPVPRAATPAAGSLGFGDIHIDLGSRVVARGSETIPLSRIGFDLLVALVTRRGQVVTREDLMREVWGYGKGVVSRTLDTHIFELRKLLEPDPANPKHILTVWRIGYRLAD